jgi:hypothetical protein
VSNSRRLPAREGGLLEGRSRGLDFNVGALFQISEYLVFSDAL